MIKQASILIVDDIPANLKLLSEILITNRYIVRPANNGKLAILSVQAEKPDLILLDVRMPDIDGFEVCRLLKENSETADIPVIFISAFDELSDRLRGFELGAVDFITKPFEPKEVLARIHTQLEISHLRVELARHAFELIQANEKLQEKAEEIASQNEELQCQSEELKIQNEEYQRINEELSLAQKTIDESAESLNALFGSMTEMVAIHEVIYDKNRQICNYRILDCNKKFCEVVGIKKEQAVGTLATDLYQLSQPPYLEEYSRVVQSGEPFEFTTYYPPLDRYFLISVVSPKKDYFATVTTDISERKRAEEALVQEQLFSKALLDNVPVIFYLYTYPGLRMIRWNKKHEIILGFGSDEMAGRHLTDWHLPENRDDVFAAVEKVMEEGQSSLEASLLAKNGKQIPFFLTGVKFERNGKKYLMGVGTDITNRKKEEAERMHLQEQLNQAQKMESVGRLAGGVAHDFNNMLSVILGQANLSLMEMDDDNQFKRSFEQIINAANRSADLTKQLLAFARKQMITPKVLNLNEAIGSSVTLLQRMIGEDINLSWHPHPNLWQVKIDPTQIDQLLTNLLVNARDAIAGEGDISISTGTVFFDEEYCGNNPGVVSGEFVVLEISDNGCGMSKEISAKIFEPFFTTKDIGKGTGLGMATVYGIVKQNSGYINVYSEVGIGTTFKVYLPRYIDSTTSVAHKDNHTPVLGGSETILLVEDEETVLEISSSMLKGLGYHVLAANSPEKAIEIAQQQQEYIDLLLTDVIMPKMNGKILAEKLQEMRPGIKILYMSGYTSENIDRHGILMEGVHFLQKPFTRYDLAEKIRSLLNKGVAK